MSYERSDNQHNNIQSELVIVIQLRRIVMFNKTEFAGSSDLSLLASDAEDCVSLENTGTDYSCPSRELVKSEAARVLDKAVDTTWQNEDIEREARLAAHGFAISYDNGMNKQAQLHLEKLELACSQNAAVQTVSVFRNSRVQAKPFAICSEAVPSFTVEGDGYTWQIDSIDISSELIPTQYLARIEYLRGFGIEPDFLYVGSPYSMKKPTMGRVLNHEFQTFKQDIKAIARQAKRTGKAVLKELQKPKNWKLPDPVLLVGFGYKPCVLVEISRWE